MYKQEFLQAIKDVDLRKQTYFILEGEPFPAIAKNYVKLIPENYDVFIRVDGNGDICLVIEHENGYVVFNRYHP